MTLEQFRDVLLAADSSATHYTSNSAGNYTVWAEYGDKALFCDDSRDEQSKVWKIQVDRYTKTPYDSVVDSIRAALTVEDISYTYLCDFEQETGYIHHIFDCEVV